MAGRALAFADRDNIKIVKEHFIPIAADEWYLRRQVDEEGDYFNRVADQGPLRRGGGSRQGIYAMTAGGRFLFHAWGDVSPDVLRRKLDAALQAFQSLGPKERLPGQVKIADTFEPDPNWVRRPPPGALILRVYSRALDRKNGELCACDERVVIDDKIGIPVLTAYDRLWITEPESKAMVGAAARKGDSFAVPATLLKRIMRFHLVDNTRGEPGWWKTSDIHNGKMILTVQEATAAEIRLRLEGGALLASDADPTRAKRGYDVSLLGYVHYDAAKKSVTRFDLLAVGTRWGPNPWSTSRPGRTPMGIFFELAPGDRAEDGVPPAAARDLKPYLTGEGS